MTLANRLLEEAYAVQRKIKESHADNLRGKDLEEFQFQSRIFERAQAVFDRCIAEAQRATKCSGSTSTIIDLGGSRFDRSDFTRNLNAWHIAVLALNEHGLSAKIIINELREPNEMTGGMSNVYTPYIHLAWEK